MSLSASIIYYTHPKTVSIFDSYSQVDEQVTAEKPQAADGKEVKKWVN